MQGLFTSDDPWSGGFFELSMQFERLTPGLQFRAQAALWGHESLQGAYLRRDIDPSAQPRVEPAMVADSCYGVATAALSAIDSKYVKAVPKANGLCCAEAHTLLLTLQHSKLMTKRENLDLHPGTRPERRPQHKK